MLRILRVGMKVMSRRSSGAGVTLVEVVENFPDDLGLGDEGDDSEFTAAIRANEGVVFKDPLDQISPPPAESGPLFRGKLRLVGFLGGVVGGRRLKL